ncbi:hypothetical protein SB394_27560 [Burkholderia sp. BCCIQ04A]|uniref:Surface-adhesin protein E-like domain-containing protein n=2 Tax=Burkholderia TaxID=32008 RepID=A0ABS1B2G2_BURVI|nr:MULTISPECIES: surface-adhesin E family protein [Burkholderia]MEB2503868.1 hypothetical protein [Burkholderia anthinoferrum]MEB2533290.1 hypothetical protein [Burkholderia anthinoferrum]MEB2561528.1 hypothetical protein [Burkholderia anthinoferrum]MEB2579560.1 hypothetical protein [Burkholderia anthinoferrum]OUE48167.1 hypothetical protein BZY94_02455 [Burkholderia territorii]
MEIRFSAKQVLLAVAVCSTLMAATSAASASEWYVYPSSQYGHLLAEKAQMVKSGDTVKFWSVQLPLRGKSGQPVYTKTVYAINCGQRTYSILQNTAYDANESGIDIPVAQASREIEPDSKEDALAGFACGPKSNAWESVNNVAEFLHARAHLAKQGLTD